MNLYLDSSALNRLFDDQVQARIYLEAAAMLIIFELVEQGRLTLLSSEVIDYELRRNPYEERQLFITAVLAQSKKYQILDKKTITRAQYLEQRGIKALDALHLACAEQLKADAFITCDDKLLKSAASKILSISPPQFVVNLTQGEVKNGNT